MYNEKRVNELFDLCISRNPSNSIENIIVKGIYSEVSLNLELLENNMNEIKKILFGVDFSKLIGSEKSIDKLMLLSIGINEVQCIEISEGESSYIILDL